MLASNSKYLLSHRNVKNLPFLITAIKVGKRKLLPFSDETYDACSLIHAGCKDNKVSVLKGISATVGRKFTSKHVVSELNNGKNTITRNL